MHSQQTTQSIRFTTRHAFLVLTGLVAALWGIARPRLRREVDRLARTDGQGLVVADVDHTGQKVPGGDHTIHRFGLWLHPGSTGPGLPDCRRFLDAGTERFASPTGTCSIPSLPAKGPASGRSGWQANPPPFRRCRCRCPSPFERRRAGRCRAAGAAPASGPPAAAARRRRRCTAAGRAAPVGADWGQGLGVSAEGTRARPVAAGLCLRVHRSEEEEAIGARRNEADRCLEQLRLLPQVPIAPGTDDGPCRSLLADWQAHSQSSR